MVGLLSTVATALGPAAGSAVAALQTADLTDTVALLQIYELVGAVLGLFIAYQAYRGYRRNDSRPMFFISLGFVLILGMPVLLFLGYLVGPGAPDSTLQAIIQTFEIVGLLCIIYALRVEP